MRRLITIIATLLTLTVFAFAEGVQEENDTITIGISQLISHPALDNIAKGITDYLDQSGIDYKVDLQIANGEISTASSIAQLFKSNGYDYVVGIATPTAQALANTFTDGTPVIYATVTDPTAAGLDDLGYVCGTTDQPPIEKHIEILESILGGTDKTIGMLYTSTEVNGLSQMESMKAELEKRGFEFVSQSVNNSAEVRQATEAIIDRVDAIYVSTDNTVISAIASVSDVCLNNNIPLFTADTTSSFGTSVLIAGGFDYYKAGLQTGRIVADVINGTNPSDIGMEYVEQQEIYINLDTAEELGITIDDALIDSAAYVLKYGENIKASN